MQRPFPGFRLEQLREMSMRRGGGASLEGKWSLVGDGFETPVRHRAGPGKGAVRRQTQDTGPRSGLEMSQGEPSAHGSDDRLFRPSGRDAPLASMEHLPRAGPPRAAWRLTVQTGARDAAEDVEWPPEARRNACQMFSSSGRICSQIP